MMKKSNIFVKSNDCFPAMQRRKNFVLWTWNVMLTISLKIAQGATLEALCAAIGTPQSIAESFLERIDPEQLSHKMSAKRKIAIGVIAVVAALAIAIGIVVVVFADDLRNYHNGYDVDIHYELPSDTIPSPLEEY